MSSCILCDEEPVPWPEHNDSSIPYLLYDDLSLRNIPICLYHLNLALRKCEYLDKIVNCKGEIKPNTNDLDFSERKVIEYFADITLEMEYYIHNRVTDLDRHLTEEETDTGRMAYTLDTTLTDDIFDYIIRESNMLVEPYQEGVVKSLIKSGWLKKDGKVFLEESFLRIEFLSSRQRWPHSYRIDSIKFNEWLMGVSKKLAKEYESYGFIPPRCKLIKTDGNRCTGRCWDGGDYCSIHKGKRSWHNPQSLEDKSRLDKKLELTAKILTDEIPMENVRID